MFKAWVKEHSVCGLLICVITAILICFLLLLTLVDKGDSTEIHKEFKELRSEVARIESELLLYKKMLIVANRNKHLIVDVTAFTPSTEECNSNPFVTATNTKTTPGRTVAVSRDLFRLLGRTIYIPPIKGVKAKYTGVRKVEDVMNERFTNRIDLCVPTKEEARIFGIKKAIPITVLY